MVANMKLRHTTGRTWTLAKSSAASYSKESFLVLKANSQHLVRAPSWAAKTIVEDLAVPVQWMFRLELCDCTWNLPHVCLWTLASQLSEGLRVLGGQRRTSKFMSCSGHLPSFDPTLGGLPSANPLFLLGTFGGTQGEHALLTRENKFRAPKAATAPLVETRTTRKAPISTDEHKGLTRVIIPIHCVHGICLSKVD